MERSWLTVGDLRVDDAICRGNARQGWVPLDQVFQSGHQKPTGHPACRCDLLVRRKPAGIAEARRLRLVEHLRGKHDQQTHGKRITSIGPREVINLGSIRREVLQHWPGAVTKQVVLTGERRQHVLDRHPEMREHERSLKRVLVDPDEVHRDRRDPQVAIFYRRLNEEKSLRAAVWVSPTRGLKNSVHSYRVAARRELEDGRTKGRMVWGKS